MYIPTHYVILFAAILLAESGVLFVYTLVGLVKNNPLPWAMGPPQNDAPLCRYEPHGQTVVRGQPMQAPKDEDQPFMPSIYVQTSVSVITSMVYQTADPANAVMRGRQDGTTLSGMQTLVIPNGSRESSTSPSATSSSDQTSSPTKKESATAVSTVTAPKATVTVGSTSDGKESDSKSSGSSDHDPKPSDEPSDSDDPTSRARTTKKGPVTSVVVLTTTPPAPTEKPRPTITSVIVLPAPESTGN